MPNRMFLTFTSSIPIEVDVATEEEVLEFANTVRSAGAGAPLAALLPSCPYRANQCLVANALNFRSDVRLLGREVEVGDYRGIEVCTYPSGAWQWVMIPQSQRLELLTGIGRAAKLPIVAAVSTDIRLPQIPWGLLLPESIGNAARAFDIGAAFQDLVGDDS